MKQNLYVNHVFLMFQSFLFQHADTAVKNQAVKDGIEL